MVDTVQPHGLLSFRNRSASSLLSEDAAAEMEQHKTNQGHDTRQASSTVRGLDVAKNPAFRSREKNFLDIPFYRPGRYSAPG